MKNLIIIVMITSMFPGLFGCRGKENPSAWNESKTKEWFDSGDWRNGWPVMPDSSIDKKAMAAAYFKNRARWDSAFAFLRNNDLSALEARRHDIDGDKLYVSITDYNTKNPEEGRYEAHRKYADIQYVVSGKELIGITPLTSADSILQEYDPARDIEFMRVQGGKFHTATPGNFFVFFPTDAHMPGLKTDSVSPVRKVVVKVSIE